jgi:sporulation protein YlmC with PRC-barrel domain
MDIEGHRVGQVDDLILDRDTGEVRFLNIGSGGLMGIGRHHVLVPVDVVDQVAPDSIFLDTTREAIDSAPEWQTQLDDTEYIADVCSQFRCVPYWTEGYVLPDWTKRD